MFPKQLCVHSEMKCVFRGTAVPESVRGIVRRDWCTRGSSAEFTNKSGTFTFNMQTENRFKTITITSTTTRKSEIFTFKSYLIYENKPFSQLYSHCECSAHSFPSHSTLLRNCVHGIFQKIKVNNNEQIVKQMIRSDFKIIILLWFLGSQLFIFVLYHRLISTFHTLSIQVNMSVYSHNKQ